MQEVFDIRDHRQFAHDIEEWRETTNISREELYQAICALQRITLNMLNDTVTTDDIRMAVAWHRLNQ